MIYPAKNFLMLLIVLWSSLVIASPSPYGMVAHLNRMSPDEMVRELDGLKQMGFSFVRFDADWGQLEATPGQWDFSRLDRVVAECRARKMDILLILPGIIPKHSSPPFRHLDRWDNFVTRLTEHYRGRIGYYEIFNEVDCSGPWGETPSPENYTALLKRSYALIKKADPAATVLFSGLSDFNDPFPFWDKAFAAGAGASFDAINLHPYQMKNFPEARLPRQLDRVRELMRRYGLNKPIWITEIGNSTAPFQADLTRNLVDAALRKLNIIPERTTFAVIADDRYMYYTFGPNMTPVDYLGQEAKYREVDFAGIDRLDVKTNPVLLLPVTEEFPGTEIGHIRDFVQRGGTIVLIGGLPFYFDLIRYENGLDRVQVNKKYLPQLHLDWFAVWSRPQVPSLLHKLVPAEAFPGLRLRQINIQRFPDPSLLQSADQFIPLAYGVGENGFKAPIAALYRMNSDLKGNIIFLAQIEGGTSSSPEMQATLLVRQYLIARGNHVVHTFYYRYRAGEFDQGTESHYGVIRRNFTPKPAAAAAAFLTQTCPASSEVKLTRIGQAAMRADWMSANGLKWCAVWGIGRRVQLDLRLQGQIQAAFDCLGRKIAIPTGTLAVESGVVYLQLNKDSTLELSRRL